MGPNTSMQEEEQHEQQQKPIDNDNDNDNDNDDDDGDDESARTKKDTAAAAFVDLLATIELQFARVEAKLRAVRDEKQAQLVQQQVDNNDEGQLIDGRLATCVERSVERVSSELERQRGELLERVREEVRASLESGRVRSEFEAGVECGHLLNDASHLIGSVGYTRHPFSCLQKLAYFSLLDQFGAEIRLRLNNDDPNNNNNNNNQNVDDNPPRHLIVTPVRILVLVSLNNRLLVHLNRVEMDRRDAANVSYSSHFKIYNFKWNELYSLQLERSMGTYKNLIAIDSHIDHGTDRTNARSGLHSERTGVAVGLFAQSENGRHWLRVYDARLKLVTSTWFDFNIKLIAWIGGPSGGGGGELACWRTDCSQIYLLNSRLEIMSRLGQDADPAQPFYFPSSSSSLSSSSSTTLLCNLIDMSSSLILLYTADEHTQTQRVQIISRSTGATQGCIEFGFNSFPNTIKLDSHSNILVRTCGGPAAASSFIKYFDSRGQLLTQLGYDANNPNRFARFNRIDIIRARANSNGDQLVCFCKEDLNILFF